MGKNRVESALKKFLKRKIKITTAFVVSFLVTGTMGYSEIIDKTVEIKLENGQITITPNPEGTLEGNTWTHNGIIDVQNGNGISISQDITEDKNFSIINNGIIKGNKNGNDNFSGNGIYNDKGIISSLTNIGVISGKSKITGEISEVVSGLGNGIYNNNGTITTLTNIGVISGNTNIDISKAIMNITNLGNGIYNNGTITTLTNIGVISGEIETTKEISQLINSSGNGISNKRQITKLINTGVVLGKNKTIKEISGRISSSGNGIYNNKEIEKLTNNGVILGEIETTKEVSGSISISGNGILNNFEKIEKLTNSGVISGEIKTTKEISGNIDSLGNGILNNRGTITTLTNSGVILGNGNGDYSGNGIYNNKEIEKLTNNGIIAGSNKAIDGVSEDKIVNNGLLIDGAGTTSQKITVGTGGIIENSQSEYDGYTVMNGEVTIDKKKTKDISVSSAFSSKENAEQHIFNLADSSFVADKNFILKDSIINSYQSNENNSTVKITGETTFKTENVTFNGTNNDSIVIQGDEKNNTLVLAGNTQINGKIDLAGTNDKDKIFFEKSLNTNTKADNNETDNDEVYIHHDISGAEEIVFNNHTILFETAKITGADKIYIGDGGQLTLRVDASQKDKNNDKIIGHGLYGENGDSTTISSTVKGKLYINFIGGQNKNIISFGNNKLENIKVDFTNPLFSTDGGGKNPTNEIQVFVNKNLDGVIGTPDGLKKDIDISLYDKLNKIYKSMYSVDGLLGTEFAGLTDDTTGEFLKYLHDIYAGNPYAYSSELSRKTMGMMRNLADKDLNPELNKWAIYGGLSHVDGGTKESFYGRNYYGYDIGSRDISADTKITGGYFKAEYGKSDTVTTGLIFGGNNAESEIGSSKVEGDSFYFGGYAKKFINDFRFTLGAGFQHGDYKADRTAVGYSNITETRKFDSNYHDRGFDIYGDIKYSKEIGNGLFFEPSFTLSYTYLDEDGASEKGTLGIETDSKTFDYLSSEINLDVRKIFMTDKLTHSFVAGVSYERLLNGYEEEYITGRIIGGTDFDILVPEKEKDNFFVNARYELETEKGMLFDVKCSYRFEYDNNQDEWTVGAGMGYRF